MELKVLIENKSCNEIFKTEHGLSIYIDTGLAKLLIDAGESGDFIYNAEKMGVDIKDIDILVASHSHLDHTGGIPKFFDINDKAKLFISKNANQKLFFRAALFIKEDVSSPREIFSTYKNRISFVDDFLKIDDNIYIVSGFKRKYPMPGTNRRLLALNGKKYEKDYFNHESAVVIDNNGKLVVITGCSHSGVDNMIEKVLEHFPGYPIQTVIGGFHLMSFILPKYMGEKKKNITELGERLISYSIEKTYTCHCTGDRAFGILRGVMDDKIGILRTGDQLEL